VKREDYLRHPTRPAGLSQVKTAPTWWRRSAGPRSRAGRCTGRCGSGARPWPSRLLHLPRAVRRDGPGRHAQGGRGPGARRCVTSWSRPGEPLPRPLRSTGGLHYWDTRGGRRGAGRHDIDPRLDTVRRDQSFQKLDAVIVNLAAGLEPRPYSTRDSCSRGPPAPEPPSASWASRQEGVPVFCRPSTTRVGDRLGAHVHQANSPGARIRPSGPHRDNSRSPAAHGAVKGVGRIYIGGGVPKNTRSRSSR